MNGPDLCARDTSRDILCGYCVHLTDKKLMQMTQHACITTEHILPFHKLSHKKWLLMHPPEPPFVVLQSDAKLAHMIWRTPVTISKDSWYVRLGRRQLIVRMPLVRAALECFASVADRFGPTQQGTKEGAVPTRLLSPSAALGYELDDMDFWRIRSDVRPYLSADDLASIHRLRPGEYWALAILCSKKEPTDPLKPELQN
jgi:CRISPR type IV-associated protein Csf1